MIDQQCILDWRKQFPWSIMQQVEQDLLISRAVVAIYSDDFLASRLAWRGGTALYKLHLKPVQAPSQAAGSLQRGHRPRLDQPRADGADS